MAGDWIKFEKATLDKPEVFEMATELSIDPDAVIGKLLRVWNWFDDQSENGNASVTVSALLDRYAGVTGFTQAMETVGWMIVEGDIMHLPNFDRHNGTTAKNRCNTNRRVAKSRSMKRKCNALPVTNVTVEPLQKPLQKPLPEKRREEKSNIKTPLPPEGEAIALPHGNEFAEAWKSWTQHRKEIKKPLKPTSTKSQLKMLSEMREGDAVRMINYTVTNGWQGLRAENATASTSKPNPRNAGTHNEGQTFGAGTNPNQVEFIEGLY